MRKQAVRRTASTIVLLSLAVGIGFTQSGEPLTVADGDQLVEKLAIISENATEPGATAEPTVVYQREVNAYLRFQAARQIPPAITEPHVELQDTGGISVQATVDLSAFGSDRPRSVLDPMRYLTGRLPVAASGRLETDRGVGQVEVESVTVGGVPVPASVLSELVRYYTRTEEQPQGIDLTEPFELPYGIDELRVESRQAVVMQ